MFYHLQNNFLNLNIFSVDPRRNNAQWYRKRTLPNSFFFSQQWNFYPSDNKKGKLPSKTLHPHFPAKREKILWNDINYLLLNHLRWLKHIVRMTTGYGLSQEKIKYEKIMQTCVWITRHLLEIVQIKIHCLSFFCCRIKIRNHFT